VNGLLFQFNESSSTFCLRATIDKAIDAWSDGKRDAQRRDCQDCHRTELETTLNVSESKLSMVLRGSARRADFRPKRCPSTSNNRQRGLRTSTRPRGTTIATS